MRGWLRLFLHCVGLRVRIVKSGQLMLPSGTHPWHAPCGSLTATAEACLVTLPDWAGPMAWHSWTFHWFSRLTFCLWTVTCMKYSALELCHREIRPLAHRIRLCGRLFTLWVSESTTKHNYSRQHQTVPYHGRRSGGTRKDDSRHHW